LWQFRQCLERAFVGDNRRIKHLRSDLDDVFRLRCEHSQQLRLVLSHLSDDPLIANTFASNNYSISIDA